MWCCKRQRAGGVRAILAGAALLALAACGFEPLYGRQGGTWVAPELGAVEVAPIDDPLGPELALMLRKDLAPKRSDNVPRYRLVVQLSKGSIPLVTEKDSQVSRFDYFLAATYSLQPTAGEGTLDSGSVRTLTSYNIVQGADYAALVAEKSAGREAAREVSRKIVNRLALYFHKANGS